MTNEEYAEIMDKSNFMIDSANPYDMDIKEALEKQIPKKPMLMKFDHYDSYFCKCGLGFGNSIMMIRPNYCERCGQKLDWGNENDRAD